MNDFPQKKKATKQENHQKKVRHTKKNNKQTTKPQT